MQSSCWACGRFYVVSLTLAVITAACSSPGQAVPLHTVASLTVPVVATLPDSPFSTTATSTSAAAQPRLSLESAMYLTEALDLMHIWSINRDLVDWEALRSSAFRVADGAETPADTYRAVEVALSALHDDHSVFFTPNQALTFDSGPAVFVEPVVEVRDGGVGYVSIGRYSGNIGEQADRYATSLAHRLAADLPSACGWIVDLRLDSGGNMWPMIGGLAPLLGDGAVGSFVYRDGTVETWELLEGVAYWDGQPMTVFDVSAPETQRPVAVLVGHGTASSGEATAVAFQGRENTRFFGEPTAGLTTSNEPLFLADGAMMALTMSVFADRTGVSYGQGISVEPDEMIAGDPTPAATEWLLGQPTCAT